MWVCVPLPLMHTDTLYQSKQQIHCDAQSCVPDMLDRLMICNTTSRLLHALASPE